MHEAKYDLLAAYCLRLLRQKHGGDGTNPVTVQDIYAHFPENFVDENLIAPDEIDSALALLEKNEWARRFHYPYTADRFEITNLGRGVVSLSNAEEKFSPLFLYLKFGDEWLYEAFSNMAKAANAASVSEENSDNSKEKDDNSWEPLPLDRKNPALEKAADSLDQLANELAEDNGYAANEPDERNYVVSGLKEGAKALREQTAIYKQQFHAFIWQPLELVASRFGKNAKGVMATATKELLVEALKHLAKHLF